MLIYLGFAMMFVMIRAYASVAMRWRFNIVENVLMSLLWPIFVPWIAVEIARETKRLPRGDIEKCRETEEEERVRVAGARFAEHLRRKWFGPSEDDNEDN